MEGLINGGFIWGKAYEDILRRRTISPFTVTQALLAPRHEVHIGVLHWFSADRRLELSMGAHFNSWNSSVAFMTR